MANNKKKEGGETPLTDEEKAALAAQGEGGEGKEGEGNEGEGAKTIVEVHRVLEILNRFKVDECFETSDGSIFLSKNLAMLHTAQDAKKVKTHERKDFE